MRTLIWILITCLLVLWGYYATAIAPHASRRPVPVEAGPEELSAGSLNNRGVILVGRGQGADALAFFERAHQLRPDDVVIARNYAWQRAREQKRGWLRALGGGSLGAFLLTVWSVFVGTFRRIRDRFRLGRTRVRGEPWVRIDGKTKKAELNLHFTEPVGCLLRRHPLVIVWSSAQHGKHMKSRPEASAKGATLRVPLKGHRLNELRRYPGDWKAFLYLGKTPVGRAAARVG